MNNKSFFLFLNIGGIKSIICKIFLVFLIVIDIFELNMVEYFDVLLYFKMVMFLKFIINFLLNFI